MHTTAVVYLVLFLIICVHGYNIDTNNIIVYVDPAKSSSISSYFGYTVVLFRDKIRNNAWLKIGAPRAQDPNLSKIRNPGVVYNCPFLQQCKILEHINTDVNGLANAWIGGTMDINYNQEVISICGFRRTFKGYLAGACYLSQLNETLEENVHLPNQTLSKNNRTFLYGQGQIGFSAHFATNERHLILGAPGVDNWSGITVDVEYSVYDSPQASRLRSKRAIYRDVAVTDSNSSKVNSDYDLFGYAVTSGYFYGNKKLYYVASTPKNLNEEGTTHKGKGKVATFQFNGNMRNLQIKDVKVGYEFGEYFGASINAGDVNGDGYDDLIVGAPFYSGGTTGKTYDVGRVYVFLGQEKALETNGQIINGQSTKGQFGNAIMFLNDINNDGYGDVAIGAPYEDELSGVLYIYKGTNKGLKYSQRIVGKDILPEISGFGISISRPADINGNGYEDIAVGAHLSGHAVILRTKPIVVINTTMRAYPELKRETKRFSLEICYKYSYFNESIVEIERTLVIDELLGRATINKSENVKPIQIKGGNGSCETIPIYVKTTTNYKAPITALLYYKLIDQPQSQENVIISGTDVRGNDVFCTRCPVLDESRTVNRSSLDIHFTPGCGNNTICQANLSIDAILNLKKKNTHYTFVVGSANSVDLEVTVYNTGQKAYGTKLEIILPNNIFLTEVISTCEEKNMSMLICSMDDPLRENDTNTVKLGLDMKNINYKYTNEDKLFILLRVLTTSKNNNTNRIQLQLNLERIADIEIYGNAMEQSLPFGNATHGMPNFTHKYTVQKIGLSPLGKVVVNIAVPYALHTPNGNINFTRVYYEPSGIFAKQPIKCTSDFNYLHDMRAMDKEVQTTDDIIRQTRDVEVVQEGTSTKSEDIKIGGKEYGIAPNKELFINCDTENVICSNISCFIGPFEGRSNTGIINIKMMFDVQAISGLLEISNIYFTTRGYVTIENLSGLIQNKNSSHSKDVSSIFINETPFDKKVALWIIIVSVIVGLLLLVLIVYGLTKVGFFKRTKKEELNNLKAAVEQENEQPNNDSTEDLITDDLPFETSDSSILNSSQEGLK